MYSYEISAKNKHPVKKLLYKELCLKCQKVKTAAGAEHLVTRLSSYECITEF